MFETAEARRRDLAQRHYFADIGLATSHLLAKVPEALPPSPARWWISYSGCGTKTYINDLASQSRAALPDPPADSRWPPERRGENENER